MEPIKNPITTHKIRFSDCDMFGHLHNSRYLDYLIDAREDHLKNIYNFDLKECYKNNSAWVIKSHEIEYLQPAYYDELVYIQSNLLHVEEHLIHVELIMMNKEQTHLKAVMRSKLVPINLKTGKKEAHQTEFLNWAQSIINNDARPQLTLQERVMFLLTELKALLLKK